MLKMLSVIVRWSVLLCVPGGVLWALTPLGISLSEYRFSTPDVFWKLFPSVSLLLMLGLIGLQLRQSGRSGWPGRVGFTLAFLGLALIVAGDIGKYWLDIDDTYLTLAPAYRAMRIGFLLFTSGSVAFGISALRALTLPVWGVAPLAVFSVGGLVAVSVDLGTVGAPLWVLFGTGWAWLGLRLSVDAVVASWRARRKPRVG